MRILLDGNSPFARAGGRSPGPRDPDPPPVVIWFIILGVRRGPLLELRELEFRGVKPLPVLLPAEDAPAPSGRLCVDLWGVISGLLRKELPPAKEALDDDPLFPTGPPLSVASKIRFGFVSLGGNGGGASCCD